MTSFTTWLEAARPKTIAASLSPVAIGAVAAAFHGDFSLNLLLWITLAAVTFQVSANYANDYFDFVQGNDTENRKGFRRATASGLVSAAEMKRAMIITLVISALLSIYLVAIGGLPIALIALLFLACSLLYSVGKKSLAARGLGELTVLVLFGLIGVNVTYYLFTQTISIESILISWIPGLLASNVMLMNNMRDVEEDKVTGKKTIAVRFGVRKCKMLYLIQLCMAGAIPSLLVMATSTHFWTPLANIAFVPLLPTLRALLHEKEKSNYNNHFITTVKTLVFYTVAFCVTYGL